METTAVRFGAERPIGQGGFERTKANGPRRCALTDSRTPPPPDDLLLLFRRIVDGDRRALEALAPRLPALLHPAVAYVLNRHRWALRGRDPRQELEDSIHNVVVVLYKDGAAKLKSWDESRAHPRRFLSQVARSVTLTSLNKRLDELAPDSAPPLLPVPSEERRTLSRDELKRLLERLFEALTPKERWLFDLWYVEELSAHEVAELLGMTPPAVNAMRFRIGKKVAALSRESTPKGPWPANVLAFPTKEPEASDKPAGREDDVARSEPRKGPSTVEGKYNEEGAEVAPLSAANEEEE